MEKCLISGSVGIFALIFFHKNTFPYFYFELPCKKLFPAEEKEQIGELKEQKGHT